MSPMVQSRMDGGVARSLVIKPTASLRQNVSWAFAGNAIWAACQWGMLIVLAKVGDVAMVGQFALGLAITAPVFMLSNLQLRSILVTDARGEFPFVDYLGLRILTIAMSIVTIIGIALVTGYRWSVLCVILGIGIVKALESLSELCYALMQRHEQMDLIAKAQAINGLLAVALLSAGMLISGNLLVGVSGWALAYMITLGAWNLPAVRQLMSEEGERTQQPAASVRSTGSTRPRFHWSVLTRLVWLALPLGLVMMLISLNTNLPRYILERYAGEKELGIFASLAYLLVAGGMVSMAIGQATSPRLAHDYATGNHRAFLRLVAQMVAIGMLMGSAGVVIAAVAGQSLLRVIYTPEYAGHVDVLIWLTVSAGIGFMASAFGFAITAARHFRAQVPLFLGVMGVTLVAAYLLIPSHGLLGAAWTSLITTTTQLVGSVFILWLAVREGKPRLAQDD